MGTDSKLWMLELNNSPAYNNKLRDRRFLFDTQIPKMLEIPFKYLRSRFRRVRYFLTEKMMPKIMSGEYQKDKNIKENLLKEFDLINTDYLEPDL